MSDLLSGLANLTKQVTSNISTYEIRKITEKVQGMVMNFTETETIVREATNEDPWGPTGPQMKEISHLTFQYDAFNQIMETLWKRMLEDNKFAWRRVYKSLTLLNYLLQHGSERVINNARDHVFQMRSLEHYKFLDEKGKDQGVNIRHRAGIILELLGDDEKLRAERKKAKGDNKERYQGFTSDDIKMGRGGNFNGNNKSSRDFNDDYSFDRKKSSFNDDLPPPRDDYSSKEVNSFQFPEETRRNSVSPELGFRQETTPPEADDDGFGDFASARSTAKSPSFQVQTAGITRAGAIHIPALAPPGGVSAARVSAAPQTKAVDLLGLDSDPVPAAPANHTVDLFANFDSAPVANNLSVRPPRPPSGGGISPISFGVSPVPAQTSQPALIDDIFGTPVSAAAPVVSPVTNDFFSADWSSAPAAPVPVQASSQPNFASFDDFGSFASASAPITAVSTPSKQASMGGLDDIFSGMGGGSLTPQTNTMAPAAVSPLSTPQTKAQPQAKIGSTWAGAGGLSGLIDLDNLGGKTTVKQSPSLNQMQQNKQGASSNMPW